MSSSSHVLMASGVASLSNGRTSAWIRGRVGAPAAFVVGTYREAVVDVAGVAGDRSEAFVVVALGLEGPDAGPAGAAHAAIAGRVLRA